MRWITFVAMSGLAGTALAQPGVTAPAPATTTAPAPATTTAPAPATTTAPARAAKAPSASAAAEALARGAPMEALTLAQQASVANPKDPWAHYNRAAALAEMRQPDDAVAEYKQAESLFATSERWGRSVAVWGRASALAQAGRCTESADAYQQYAGMVEAQDADGAALARHRAESCKAQGASAGTTPAPAAKP